MDYKLYRIRWLDSSSSYGWVQKDEIKADNLEVNSVAYLIKEYEDQIIVSAHIADTCVDAPMTIPKIAIIAIVEIADA